MLEAAPNVGFDAARNRYVDLFATLSEIPEEKKAPAAAAMEM
jgi:hypothetical protein